MSPTLTTALTAPASPTDHAAARPAPVGHAARPRVLLITHRTPYPPDKGDRIRSYNVLRYLSARARVDLAALSDEPVTAGIQDALHELAERVEIVPVQPRLRWLRAAASAVRGRSATEGLFASPQLRRRLAQWTAATPYDLVVAVCSGMAQYIDRSRLRGAHVLMDLIDVDSQKWLDYAASSQGWRRAAYAIEARRVRRLETQLAAAVDQVAVVTAAEADCYRAFCPTAPVVAIPNGVDLDFFRPNPALTPLPDSCVFVGALDYKPNVDGIQWFCDEVWPTIRARRPAATLSIVGRRPVKSVQRLADLPGVQLHADVPDVRPHLWRSQVAVVPLCIARGVQNKVLEALAAGTPVIASPQAAHGLDIAGGEHLELADTPGQWAAAVDGLLGSESERRRLAAAGRHFVCNHHCWDACLAPLGDLLLACHSGTQARS